MTKSYKLFWQTKKSKKIPCMSRENCLINPTFLVNVAKTVLLLFWAIPAESRLCWRPQPQTDWPSDFSRCPNFAGARKSQKMARARAEKQMQERRSALDAYREAWFSFFWVFFSLKKYERQKKNERTTRQSPHHKNEKIDLEYLANL